MLEIGADVVMWLIDFILPPAPVGLPSPWSLLEHIPLAGRLYQLSQEVVGIVTALDPKVAFAEFAERVVKAFLAGVKAGITTALDLLTPFLVKAMEQFGGTDGGGGQPGPDLFGGLGGGSGPGGGFGGLGGGFGMGSGFGRPSGPSGIGNNKELFETFSRVITIGLGGAWSLFGFEWAAHDSNPRGVGEAGADSCTCCSAPRIACLSAASNRSPAGRRFGIAIDNWRECGPFKGLSSVRDPSKWTIAYYAGYGVDYINLPLASMIPDSTVPSTTPPTTSIRARARVPHTHHHHRHHGRRRRRCRHHHHHLHLTTTSPRPPPLTTAEPHTNREQHTHSTHPTSGEYRDTRRHFLQGLVRHSRHIVHV